MGIISIMALATNVGSVLLLRSYKDGDANVRSVWLCSRNDAIGNIAVMAASLMVFVTSSALPDIVVAWLWPVCSCALPNLFLYSLAVNFDRVMQNLFESEKIQRNLA